MKTETKEDNKDLKNGLELTITAQLFLDLCDHYPVKRMVKKRLNDFLTEAEKDIAQEYKKVYETNPEFCTNAVRMRHNLIKMLAELHEADLILATDFMTKFVKNIDVARKKGIVFFEKLNA